MGARRVARAAWAWPRRAWVRRGPGFPVLGFPCPHVSMCVRPASVSRVSSLSLSLGAVGPRETRAPGETARLTAQVTARGPQRESRERGESGVRTPPHRSAERGEARAQRQRGVQGSGRRGFSEFSGQCARHVKCGSHLLLRIMQKDSWRDDSLSETSSYICRGGAVWAGPPSRCPSSAAREGGGNPPRRRRWAALSSRTSRRRPPGIPEARGVPRGRAA